jgi:hypothetical protein
MAKSALPLLLLGGVALVVMSKKKTGTSGVPTPPPGPVPPNGKAPPRPSGGGGTASKEVWKDRQRALGFLGYDVGKVDGLYGPATANALKEFQADNGIPATGQWNEATAETMRRVGLHALSNMAWDKIREFWNYYFPQWGQAGGQDDKIEFDKLFDKLTAIVT